MLHSRTVAPRFLPESQRDSKTTALLYAISDTLIGLFLCKRYRTPDKLTNRQSRGYATKNILEILFLARMDILQRTARRALAEIDSQRKIRELTVENLLKLAALALPDAQIDKKMHCPGQTVHSFRWLISPLTSNNIVA